MVTASMGSISIACREQQLLQELQAISEVEAKDCSEGLAQIYFLTNEENIEPVNHQLATATKMKDGVFFGVSSLSTMSLIAIAEAHFAILFDRDADTIKFNQFVIGELKHAPTANVIIKQIEEYIVQKKDCDAVQRFLGRYPNAISELASRVDSPFSNAKHLQYLANMAKEGRIVCIKGGILDSDLVTRISKSVSKFGYHFSCVYLSNLDDYVTMGTYKKSIACLIENDTIIIDSHKNGSKLKRRFHYGVHPVTKVRYEPGPTQSIATTSSIKAFVDQQDQKDDHDPML